MRLPIQFAIGYPERLKSTFPRVDFFDLKNLSFEKPDLNLFRNLALAIESAKRGGNLACAMNAANEIAVKRFLQDKIGFLEMSDLIEKTMQTTTFIADPTLDDIIATHAEATRIAESIAS